MLIAAIAALALQDPISAPFGVAACALAVAIASATQDIAVDAFRVERLESASEQAAGMAGYVTGYRIATSATGAGVIALVAYLETALGLPRGNCSALGLHDRRRMRRHRPRRHPVRPRAQGTGTRAG